jgi:apolipoprotein N-acyltransferase
MASAPDRIRIAALAAGALSLSAVLFNYGTGEHPLWWALWCGLLVLLLAAPKLPGSVAFGVSATAFFLGSLNMLRYTRNILSLPQDQLIGGASLAIVVFMVTPALWFGTAILFFRVCVRRGAPWQGAFAFAFAWTSFEYLMSIWSPHGTFGDLAYTQMEDLPLLQIASVTGIWGIDFCLCLLSAMIAAATLGAGARWRGLAIGALVLIAAVGAFGAWRLQPVGGPMEAVGLIASDLPANVDISDPGKDTQHKLDAYIDHAGAMASKGARIIILPEKLGVTVPSTAKADDAILQSFADRTHTFVMAGVIRSAPPRILNEARLYVPSHTAPLTYDKHHMLPHFESRLTPGIGRTLIDEDGSRWGIEVCKDMDFPPLARQYGNDGVGILLVSAWDFDDDDWLHARMAMMRGVESGFAIARAAKEGLLTVSDSRGRILAYRSSKAAPFATLLAIAPARHETTLYDRFGDWFAWVCLCGLAALLGLQFVRRAN